METLQKDIRRAASALAASEALLICAGAGMGVDSGLPDFRGDEGFWRAYPPLKRLGISFVEMANPHWFRADPELAWGFYGHRLNLYRATCPHGGFNRLFAEGEKKKGGYFVFTSNVDGQFQSAGFSDRHVAECHGSIHHLQCLFQCTDAIWDAGDTEVGVDHATFRAFRPLPACPRCGGLARPNILMFGDYGWLSDRTDAQRARFSAWLDEVCRKKLRLAVVEVGAGHAVPTVRMLSERTVQRSGGTLIRINPRDEDVPTGHIGLPLNGMEGIAEITSDDV